MRSKIKSKELIFDIIFPLDRNFENEEEHRKESFDIMQIVMPLDQNKAGMN